MFLVSIFGALAVGIVTCYFIRRYIASKKCLLQKRLDGKLVIITGCNTGIGLETAAELARRGARIIMACRSLSKANHAKMNLLRRYGVDNKDSTRVNVANATMQAVLTPISPEQLICEHLDLSSLESVRQFADKILAQESNIDILINNAGVLTKQSEPTLDGFEIHMGINHLGHFLLTLLLMPKLKSSRSRIIIVSSNSHYFAKVNVNDLNKPGFGTAYARSKLANVIHARELSKRYGGDGIVAVSLHPGLVLSDLFRERTLLNFFVRVILKPLINSSWDGAQTTLYCALASKLVPGAYYSKCFPRNPNKQALNETTCQRVWDTSRNLVRYSGPE